MRFCFAKIVLLAFVYATAVETSVATPNEDSNQSTTSFNCLSDPAPELVENAISNDADAKVHLALFLLNRMCDHMDVSSGIELLLQAAVNEHETANYLLGSIMMDGELVEQDLHSAREYLAIAASQGHNQAQHRLGLANLWAADEETVRQEGLRWLGIAAAGGDIDAAVVLGFIHQEGLHGVDKNECLALDWYATAIILGFHDKANLHGKLRKLTDHKC